MMPPSLMRPPPPERNTHSSNPPRSLLYLRSEAAQPPSEELLPSYLPEAGALRLRRRTSRAAPPRCIVVAGVFLLTPSFQSKDGVGMNGEPRTRHRAARDKSQTRSRIFRELVHIAAEQGHSIPLGISTSDALQQCLDRAVALYRFAADQVDNLHLTELPPDVDYLSNLPTAQDPLFEVISNPQGPDVIQPHRYVLMEREARAEVEKLAAMMTQLGIAERVVRVQEAQAVLVVAAVREAAIEAGLNHDQVRVLGQHLRERLEAARTKAATPAAHKDGSAATAQKVATTLRQLEN